MHVHDVRTDVDLFKIMLLGLRLSENVSWTQDFLVIYPI